MPGGNDRYRVNIMGSENEPCEKEGDMKKQLINYQTLLDVTRAISHSKDPEEVVLMTVEAITHALKVKGCSIFLINRKTNELEVAASFGLSEEYMNKGPVSALKSIAESLKEGPVAIYDVGDDPRIQYREAAEREGIASILSVPIIARGNVIGAMRIYTSEPWEFTLEDVNFVQAMAQMTGMAIEMARYYKGLKDSIEILKTLKDPRLIKSKKRTPYEGVPVSVSAGEAGT
jgi:GAF domain-containing protein